MPKYTERFYSDEEIYKAQRKSNYFKDSIKELQKAIENEELFLLCTKLSDRPEIKNRIKQYKEAIKALKKAAKESI